MVPSQPGGILALSAAKRGPVEDRFRRRRSAAPQLGVMREGLDQEIHGGAHAREIQMHRQGDLARAGALRARAPQRGALIALEAGQRRDPKPTIAASSAALMLLAQRRTRVEHLVGPDSMVIGIK